MAALSEFTWKKTWTFWPRKCVKTQKRMRMFSTAYKGQRVIGAGGELILLVGWLTPGAYMFEKLKGHIK
jgi:hypothetical protein